MKFLQLLILLCLAAFAFAVDIVDEDFEGGVTPTGWQIWQFGEPGCAEWGICAVGDSTFMPNPAHSGTHYAWHDDDNYDTSDSWLVTDTYDLSTYTTVNVDFWRYGKYSGSYNYTGFWYSTVPSPGSTDFTEAFELGSNHFGQWWQFNTDFTSECAGEATVTFAWVYFGLYDHAEAIDDFLLTATVSLERDTWGSIKSIF